MPESQLEKIVDQGLITRHTTIAALTANYDAAFKANASSAELEAVLKRYPALDAKLTLLDKMGREVKLSCSYSPPGILMTLDGTLVSTSGIGIDVQCRMYSYE
jgi:hypothetical protein